MLTIALISVMCVVLDWAFGEPQRWHPLVGFGRLADIVEGRFNSGDGRRPVNMRMIGIMGLLLLILPFTAVVWKVSSLPVFGIALSVLALYLALGHKSLHEHARPVVSALLRGDEAGARNAVSLMVSRDPDNLDISKAVTESVLENGNDGVFGALFWFLVAGAPGVVFYRLANTLDAMWGYRNDRFKHFGWAAARLDDLLNYIPARLTALTYALVGAIIPPKYVTGYGIFFPGQTVQALSCWRRQAPHWDSPNAGPVMAAGAGALGVSIGGPAHYDGILHDRPVLGFGPHPTAQDVERALRLVRYGVLLWLGFSLLLGGIFNA